MRFLMAIGFTFMLIMSSLTQAQTTNSLKHWPPILAKQIETMVNANRNRPNAYAVFDMDNTTYQNDLTEALLPFLENKGIIHRQDLDPELKPIPFEDHQGQHESLYSYYLRLCQDHNICTPWMARSFAGLNLKDAKRYVDELMALPAGVPTKIYQNGHYQSVMVEPPRVTPGMQELFHYLQTNGIKVYIMTAGQEELIRMVASDPRYGYNVPSAQVIGASTLLKDPQSGLLTTSRWQIEQGNYNPKANGNLVISSYLTGPMTWNEGKLGAIFGLINQWQGPLMVGGDTALSDGFMLLNGPDLQKGGLRLWLARSQQQTQLMHQWRNKAAAEQKANGLKATANQNWIEVTPAQLQ